MKTMVWHACRWYMVWSYVSFWESLAIDLFSCIGIWTCLACGLRMIASSICILILALFWCKSPSWISCSLGHKCSTQAPRRSARSTAPLPSCQAVYNGFIRTFSLKLNCLLLLNVRSLRAMAETKQFT